MYRWCTDEVEPHDRFDYWREVRAKGLFGVTAELERQRRGDFFGEFSLHELGRSALVELKASSYAVERSLSDIASAPGDSICVYQQLGGGGWFGGMRGSDFAIANGSFATSHTDLPYRTRPLSDSGFHLRILKIPVSGLTTQDRRMRELSPKPFNDPALAPLLDACFADLGEAAANDDRARHRQAKQPARTGRAPDRPPVAGTTPDCAPPERPGSDAGTGSRPARRLSTPFAHAV